MLKFLLLPLSIPIFLGGLILSPIFISIIFAHEDGTFSETACKFYTKLFQVITT